MYRVMIADDEKIAIDSLRYILEKNFVNVEVISTARSGREAIERVEEAVPDIIFMDIRMPGINGIEAIREIKKQHRQIIFIVLTAFDQFDFAKEAVNLGVIEYLLKPVNRFKVVEATNKAISIIKAEKEKRRTELELREKMEFVVPILENSLIFSIIMFDENERELQHYRQIFEIEEEGGYILTIEFGDEEYEGSLENKIKYSVRSQNFYPFLRDTIKAMVKCYVGPVMLNRIVIFIPDNCSDDEFSRRLTAVEIADNLLDKLTEKLGCAFKIGIGRGYNNIDHMSLSYREALKALRYLKGSGVMHFMDIAMLNYDNVGYPEDKEKQLLQKVSSGDLMESVNILNQLFDWLTDEFSLETNKLKNKLLEIMFLVNRLPREYDNAFDAYNTGFLDEILTINDFDELRIWCRNTVEKAAAHMNSYREYNTGSLVGKAKEYIKTGYSRQITLEDVSRDINVSPQYLSKLFKEEAGTNFIDYLTCIRIRNGKQLLEESELSIKEISYKIGYSDPNYFSRLFKKIEGVTPTEYKENFSGPRTV